MFALSHQREHLALACSEVRDRICTPPHELANDLGVEHAATTGDPFDSVAELFERSDAVLQEVADSVGASREQLGSVDDLDVLAEEEYRGAGKLLADRDCGSHALILELGRHTNVEHDDINFGRCKRCEEGVRVADGSHGLVACLVEQPNEALAQQE